MTRREHHLAVTSLVLSVLSLVTSSWFAFQQWRLSERAGRAQIVAIHAENVDVDLRYAYTDRVLFRCAHDVRLYNSGGTGASLEGFEVTARLRGGTISYTSDSAASETTRPWLHMGSDDRLRMFSTKIVAMSESEKAGREVERELIPLSTFEGEDRLGIVPMILLPSETTVVHLETFFSGKGMSTEDLLFTGAGYGSIEEFTSETHDPVDLSVRFNFAGGEVATVDPLRCLFLKRA
ncbi:MAG: hypothetical protein QOE58_2626 [Actinomycetota bacterium]|jgi:hypothetical protein|nr:hypothetical protein [Actinomycetota bacterium]